MEEREEIRKREVQTTEEKVRTVQIKIEKARKWEGGKEGGREGGEDVSEGERKGERGRHTVREREGERSVQLAPSCSLTVDAQEHVSATKPQPQSGLQDPQCTGTPGRQQVTHLGNTGTEEGRREQRKCEEKGGFRRTGKEDGFASAEQRG